MDQERHTTKLTREERNNLNSSIKTLIHNFKLLTKKTPGPDGFSGEFYQAGKKIIIIPIPHNFFQKTEKKGIPLNSFYDASRTLTTKPDKDNIRNENYRPISFINTDIKDLNEISEVRSSNI